MEIIKDDFYYGDTLDISKKLLGKILISNVENKLRAVKIVEVEAYMGPNDKAAHSYNNRRTARNEIMYGPAGFSYVYMIYGMYYCFNIVTSKINKPEAILIRAGEPILGFDDMSYARYNKPYSLLTKYQMKNLTNGPGKLCKALSIDKSLNGHNLSNKPLTLTYPEIKEEFEIQSSKRINIDYSEEAKDYPWRFYIKNNSYVSKK